MPKSSKSRVESDHFERAGRHLGYGIIDEQDAAAADNVGWINVAVGKMLSAELYRDQAVEFALQGDRKNLGRLKSAKAVRSQSATALFRMAGRHLLRAALLEEEALKLPATRRETALALKKRSLDHFEKARECSRRGNELYRNERIEIEQS